MQVLSVLILSVSAGVSPQQPRDTQSSSVLEFVGLVPLAKFKALETRLDEVRAEHRRETDALESSLQELKERYRRLKSSFERQGKDFSKEIETLQKDNRVRDALIERQAGLMQAQDKLIEGQNKLIEKHETRILQLETDVQDLKKSCARIVSWVWGILAFLIACPFGLPVVLHLVIVFKMLGLLRDIFPLLTRIKIALISVLALKRFWMLWLGNRVLRLVGDLPGRSALNDAEAAVKSIENSSEFWSGLMLLLAFGRSNAAPAKRSESRVKKMLRNVISGVVKAIFFGSSQRDLFTFIDTEAVLAEQLAKQVPLNDQVDSDYVHVFSPQEPSSNNPVEA